MFATKLLGHEYSVNETAGISFDAGVQWKHYWDTKGNMNGNNFWEPLL